MDADFRVIGAGIAGASPAPWPTGRECAVLPEHKSRPGYPDAVVSQDMRPGAPRMAPAEDRLTRATARTLGRSPRTRSGLRSLLADGGLAGGFDPAAPGPFWLAGQGGHGLQASATMEQASAAPIVREAIPCVRASSGVAADLRSPSHPR
ncbi:MAG TPA: hypothetical protein PKA16_03715 [Ottowia sp.]|uniref:hypothetical protein n=1 Tax=Ottowia sp. TaxID=1898956 RepID=UPI002BD05EC1|nr:hypothetical protein [Ottowia sp.]HMN20480.1 hypothetical protein [Ottowia sp.]